MTAIVTYFLHADEKKAASVSLYYYGVLTYTLSTRTSFPETPTISLSSETAACHSCLKPKRGRKIDKEISILGMMTWGFFCPLGSCQVFLSPLPGDAFQRVLLLASPTNQFFLVQSAEEGEW